MPKQCACTATSDSSAALLSPRHHTMKNSRRHRMKSDQAHCYWLMLVSEGVTTLYMRQTPTSLLFSALSQRTLNIINNESPEY